MGLKCLFGHKWNGCKCEKCGKLRDEQHNWDLCKGKCKLCDKTCDEQHDWKGCTCSRCGKVRHDWDDCKGKCNRCGETREEDHYFDGGEFCKRCGKKPDVTLYRVMTINNSNFNDGTHSGYGMLFVQINGTFDKFLSNNISYQNIKSSWSVIREVYPDLIISSDLINAPLHWLSSETGDSIDTISTLTGIRLFMMQSELLWPKGGTVEFSVCDYFSKTDSPTEKNKDCPYFINNKCQNGSDISDCSINPSNFASCFVYKFRQTGDASVLY